MATNTEQQRGARKFSDDKESTTNPTDVATTWTMSAMLVVVEKVHVNTVRSIKQ